MAASGETLTMQPKMVQELAAAVEEPPRLYVRSEKELRSLEAVDDMPEHMIPLVDLSRLTDADEADKFRAGLQNWGLILVTNHGIEESLMDAMMSATREFFGQSTEEKQKCKNVVKGKPWEVEGYGTDKMVFEDQILDWSDRLHLKVEPANERNFATWPSHPESFRNALDEYASKIKGIRDLILRSVAKLLDIDEDSFVNKTSEKSYGFGRFNYYPPCSRPDLVLGLKPHSDGGLITILLSDNVSGLQVEKDGKWYNVPAKPYTLLINFADCMELLNNGIFRSPVHRVVTNPDKDRLSLAVFYGVDDDVVLEPVSGLIDDERPARYRKVAAKDFAAGLFKHFRLGTRFIDTLKI